MSVRPSAKPIVRRKSAAARPSKVLLTIPDFRVETSAPSSVDPDVSVESAVNSIPVASLSDSEPSASSSESTDVLQSLELAVAYQQATEAELSDFAPKTTKTDANSPVGSSSRNQTIHESTEETTSDSRHQVFSTTQEPPFRFSKNLRQNLLILGTIAASVIVCSLVARAMKRDQSGGDLANNTGASTELVDVEPAPNGTESVTAVTPDFEPTQLRPQNFAAQTPLQGQPTSGPIGQQQRSFPPVGQPGAAFANQLPNQATASQQQFAQNTQGFAPSPGTQQLQQQQLQQQQFQQRGNPSTRGTPLTQLQPQNATSQNAASQNVAAQNQEGGFDPFALPAFGGRPSGSVATQTPTNPNTVAGSANPSLNPPQLGTLQTYARQQPQNSRQPANQPVQVESRANQFQEALTVPQLHQEQQQPQPQSSNQQQPPVITQLTNQSHVPTNSASSNAFIQPPAGQFESSPYPSTGRATFQQFAAELQQPNPEPTVGSQGNRFNNQFNAPQSPVPMQPGRTADRGNPQNIDARFGTAPAANTGVLR